MISYCCKEQLHWISFKSDNQFDPDIRSQTRWRTGSLNQHIFLLHKEHHQSGLHIGITVHYSTLQYIPTCWLLFSHTMTKQNFNSVAAQCVWHGHAHTHTTHTHTHTPHTQTHTHTTHTHTHTPHTHTHHTHTQTHNTHITPHTHNTHTTPRTHSTHTTHTHHTHTTHTPHTPHTHTHTTHTHTTHTTNRTPTHTP